MAKNHHGDQFWQCSPRVNIGSSTFSHLHKRSTERIKSNAKFFADDTSLFTIVKYVNEKANALNNDLSVISNWAFNWKMLFKPDPTKPAQEVLFSKKKKNQNHPTLSLTNIQVKRACSQRNVGLILDKKLHFKKYNESAIAKITKGVAVIKKRCYSLPRKSLITICKAFLRPSTDYGDIISDQPQNESFCKKLGSVKYKTALAINGCYTRIFSQKTLSRIRI